VNNEPVDFEVPLTPQMASLLQKFGQPVESAGSIKLEVQEKSLMGSKDIAVESSFRQTLNLKTPADSVLATLKKISMFAGDASGGSKKPDSNAEAWMKMMRQFGANNMVIVESSSTLSSITSKLYRQGYRLDDMDVVAPLDLSDPVKAQVSRSVSGDFGNVAAAISGGLNPAEVKYHAWLSDANGQGITSASPAVELRLKCKLPSSSSPKGDLGLFEFTYRPQGNLIGLPQDIGAQPAPTTVAMQLSFHGLSDNQFSAVSLDQTQIMGSVGPSSFSPGSPFPSTAFGSPIFTQSGLLAIVNSEDSAMTIAEINRERQSSVCTGSQPAPLPIPVVITNSTYPVKFWSKPEGASVWVDNKLALDDALHPVVTAGSKEACTSANTLTLTKGKHHISFVYPGYREFAGDVEIDDDMTLGANLIKAR
jgi:hypothetical protein